MPSAFFSVPSREDVVSCDSCVSAISSVSSASCVFSAKERERKYNDGEKFRYYPEEKKVSGRKKISGDWKIMNENCSGKKECLLSFECGKLFSL